MTGEPNVPTVLGARPNVRQERLRELEAALSSSDIMIRVEAVAELVPKPVEARPLLVAVIEKVGLPVLPRVWAMIAICQIGDDHDRRVSRALVDCLRDPEAIVRRSALETLGVLRASWAVSQIAACLSDHTDIPEAWFDDDATPSQAARRALESIGSPEARALLASEI